MTYSNKYANVSLQNVLASLKNKYPNDTLRMLQNGIMDETSRTIFVFDRFQAPALKEKYPRYKIVLLRKLNLRTQKEDPNPLTHPTIKHPTIKHPTIKHQSLSNKSNLQRQPNGTSHYKKISDGTANADDVKKLIQELHTNHMNYASSVIGSTKNYLNANQETELVRESPAQHRYAKMMNNSYEYYSKKPINLPKGFRVDEDLSPLDAIVRDNLVLVNEAEKEVVLSFRGTMNTKDWVNNAKLALNKFRGTPRYANAEKLVQDALEKYPEYKVKLTGHSQGANLSMDLGQRYDLESFNFDPAISLEQVAEQEFFHNNRTLTRIFTPVAGDAVSILSWTDAVRGNPRVFTEHVGTTPNTRTLIDHHSSALFNPEPESTHPSGDLLVRRNTITSTFKRVAGRTAQVAGYALLGYQLEQDVTSKQSNLGKTFDVGRDVWSFIEGAAAGEAAAGTMVALGAPEIAVFGAALVAGAMVATGVSIFVNAVKPEVMEEVNDSIEKRQKGLGLGQGNEERREQWWRRDIRDAFSWLPKFQI